MQVLFTAPGGLGHLHPLLPLAHAMLRRGHDVRFASDEANCEAARRAGLATATAGVSAAARRGLSESTFGLDFSNLAPREMADLMVPYTFGGICAPAMADDLHTIVANWRPHLVVHDQLEMAAPLVATELGVPHAAHSFGSTVPMHRLAAAGEQLEPLWSAAGLSTPPLGGVFEDVYVDIRPASLPGHPPAGTHVIPERPTPEDAVGGTLPALVTEPSDRPLVYVTLGTVFSDATVLRTAVEGLVALDVRVLVTVGPHGDPDAVGPVPEAVYVTRYVPQPELLPRCAVVVCHGGSGTYLGALANGIPLLCLPQGADQFLNADAVVEAGAGLSLQGTDVTAAAVRDAVLELLRSSSYRAVAQSLAKEIAGMPSADDVAAALEAVVAERRH